MMDAKNELTLWKKIEAYFSSNTDVEFYIHECLETDKLCKALKIQDEFQLCFYYHGVKIEQKILPSNMNEMIVMINKLMVDYPNKSTTPNYIPTTYLTDDNFHNSISGRPSLVLFFAEWCSHCRHFLPEWEGYHAPLKNRFPTLFVAKIDCSQNKKYCSSLGIRSLPSIYYFGTNGYVIGVEERSLDKIIEAVSKDNTVSANEDL